MPAAPIEIRAHSVLCLQGFRGVGYSETFAAHMQAVHDVLVHEPDRPVRLTARPDTFCAVCPHLAGGCTLGGPEHEAHMRAQDEAVLARLGVEAETVLPWAEVCRRIARGVRGADLPDLCTTCPWLPLGWCAEGIDALAERVEHADGA